MEFRQGTLNDLEEIHQIMLEGIQYLKSQGSPQWQDGYGPTKVKIKEDIENHSCYVLVNEDQEITGTIALIQGVDPAYTAISEGNWEGRGPYIALHRVATRQQFRGQGIALQLLTNSLIECTRLGVLDVRIDTHRLNIPMQKVIKKVGFTYRGLVHFPILNGERIAFQKIIEQNSD